MDGDTRHDVVGESRAATDPAARFSRANTALEDEWLFGWDPTPGIVSVWVQRHGRAVIWQRDGSRVIVTHERYRPWLVATTLADLEHPVEEGHAANAASISYRELEGPPGSYGFLLSAPSESSLERALLDGATRRLGRRVSSLYELDDTYYRLGPVEQYLIQTGKVYFRGLAYEHLHRLQFDLETTALDPREGRIFLVAVRDSRGFETVLEAPAAQDEPKLILDLCRLVRDRDPDVVENHNLLGFDLPFLQGRAQALKVPLALGREGGPPLLASQDDAPSGRPGFRRRMRYSIAGRELIDTLDAVRRHDFVTRDLPSYRLKEVARYFGVAAPDRVYLSGSAVWDTYCREPEQVRRYALDDVREVDGLSRRLLGAPFALAGMAPRPYERLPWAGPAMGILEPMLVRAYIRSGAALPGPASEGESGAIHEGGAAFLFSAGVAEHVVKADVASLYPSLMRTYGIGPACDRLGVLLSLVNRLTDLRLAHKAAARAAAPGSLEASHFEAMQAAMKVLINSAYGYMGAGAMALFADRHAAGEVTRRGREVLLAVVEALRARGMGLIEGDTDGVYFAVPPDWSEHDERALVDEIARDLPSGIRLEYEGRYRAMFSYEVKNYALLTYDGDLVVRGVALRSSRAEPFGEHFLREALRCTLTGDIAGVRSVFLQTVAALRNRALPASDVAARTRLTKTPETYLRTRKTHAEGHYEALLAAGRTHWFPGERVRFYRARGNVYVWLRDEQPEDVDEEAGNVAATAQPGEHGRRHGRAEQDRRDYDVEHYLHVLVGSYAARLRKAFTVADWEQLFRLDDQLGLFDAPLEGIEPLRIGCPANDKDGDG